MKNALDTKTERKANGTIGKLDINVVGQTEALNLLGLVRRQGIYRPYIPVVCDAISKLGMGQSITFHVPVMPGKPAKVSSKRLMSTINMFMKRKQIPHRLRYVEEKNILISEKIDW
jgi:hypothetical protein